jgi:hypothetical protein
VGDSVSGQTFATVAHLLSANPAIQVQEVTPDFDVREWVVHKDEGDKGAWCFVAHGARACYLNVWNLTHTDPFYTLMTRIGSQPLDTIVFNFGVRTPPSLRRLNRTTHEATRLMSLYPNRR